MGCRHRAAECHLQGEEAGRYRRPRRGGCRWQGQARIPIGLHRDHGASPAVFRASIRSGFSSGRPATPSASSRSRSTEWLSEIRRAMRGALMNSGQHGMHALGILVLGPWRYLASQRPLPKSSSSGERNRAPLPHFNPNSRRTADVIQANTRAGTCGREGYTTPHPLTVDRAKPALPLAGGYRIVDFVLSNLVNSGITRIHVLVQYQPQSLTEHLRSAWNFSLDASGRRIQVIRPSRASAAAGFRGTADAVYQNLHLLAREDPDLVAVFAADHVYRMDVRQMAQFHDNAGADATIAALAVPTQLASSFGVLATAGDGRIVEFQEKPPRPKTIPFDPARAYASMGNYLFKPQVLAAALSRVAGKARPTSATTCCRA